jgi:hypothetical protein
MSPVEFDEQNESAVRTGFSASSLSYTQPEQKGIIGFLIRKGIVKNARQASVILIIVMIICFALAGYFLWQTYGPAPSVELTPEQLELIQNTGASNLPQ